jgi:amino acid adenylation domain-containing protein
VNKKSTLTCVVIGSENLTIQCMSMLLEKKHVVLAAISSSENIKHWCIVNSINYFRTMDDFESNKPALPVDILFSITNEHILPEFMLDYPEIGAINYHNSPLPKYAGLYATSWAILHGETEHGITWHWMKSKVDAGDILKQPHFSIDKNDTALTLNLKCYEHAAYAFSELVDELATQSETSFPQDLYLRRYYGLKNKPKRLGFVSWSAAAEEIERTCRALYFGNYLNELATSKLIISNQILIIQSCKILTEKTNLLPGSVVSWINDSLRVTTQTSDILILELLDLQGNRFKASNKHLLVGQQLEDADPALLNSLMESTVFLQPKYEKIWVNEYKKCLQNEVTFLSHLSLSDLNNVCSREMTEVKLSDGALQQLENFSKTVGTKQKYVLLAVLFIYWYRLNNYKNFSVSYSPIELQKTNHPIHIISNEIPMTTAFDDEMSLRQVLAWILYEDSRLSKCGTHMLDIFIRYPEIKSALSAIDISVKFYDVFEKLMPSLNHKFCVNISEAGDSLVICNQTNYKLQALSFDFFEKFECHLLNLLVDAINQPTLPLFKLNFLDPNEIDCLLHSWNNTNFNYNKAKLLHHYFEEQVVKRVDRIAAIFDNVTMSYDELNQKSNRVAHYLLAQQVLPNDVIGVFVHRGIEMLICILGILKAGAAYLPLDPNYPNKRIQYMLQHSKSKIMLSHHQVTKKNLGEYHGAVFDVEDILRNDLISSELPFVDVNHENLAYVIYTSGTTGTPKGVAITHQSACNHMLWMSDTYHFSDQDIFILKTPFSFDASVWEIFIPLFVGAKLVIAPDEVHTCPDTLIQLIQHNQVTIIQLVPSMLRELILATGFSACSSLQHVFCGGEVLLQETIHSFMEHNDFGALLHNLYGPTETTIDAISLTCSSTDVSSMVSRIGRPIYNTRLFVLDNRMQLVPAGVLGELYISGDGIAKGYLHQPQLTEQKFLRNPFDNHGCSRIYKTGDLVKWQADGVIEYHGRTDTQIKIRGFRIEVSEIESCLEKHPNICQYMVKAESNHDGLIVLSAYITVIDNNVMASDIRDLLKKDIPDYMIPARYFVVEKFLTTPSGKLDRKTKLIPIRQLYLAKEHVLPSTDTEIILHQIWCEILKQKDLGIHDDFFELGGQSLIAMQMIARIKKEFLVRMTIRALFDYPTIHCLSKEIEQLVKQDTDGSASCSYFENILIPIKKTGKQRPLFLVHPVGGSVFWYTLLGQYLDPDIPLYGLQDPGIDANAFIFESIDNMAQTYIEVVRSIQPNGPYVLGGASFGSTVAIEMA